MSKLLTTIVFIGLNFIGLDNPLEKYRWKNRLVLIFNNDSSLLNEQMKEFESRNYDLEERDLLVLKVEKEGESLGFTNQEADYLWNKYTSQYDQDNFIVVLIGKDGSVKSSVRNRIMTATSLFALIDTMPMRKAEMKKH